ncbi:FHOD3 protein, partial [Pseudoatta argentina]
MYRQMFFTCQVQYLNDVDPFSYPTLYPDVNPPDHTFSATLPLINQLAAVHRLLRAPHRLDDTALQLYKGGDYGAYLDLEASINEQQEEFEGFHEGERKKRDYLVKCIRLRFLGSCICGEKCIGITVQSAVPALRKSYSTGKILRAGEVKKPVGCANADIGNAIFKTNKL